MRYAFLKFVLTTPLLLAWLPYPFTKKEYGALNTLVFPDPWLIQEGPVTFPACALYQLFVRSCNLAHVGPTLYTFLLLQHIAACFCISLWCFASVAFCSQMDKHQNVRPSTGTTEWNHSYYAGSSLSALHSSQQLHDDTVSTSAQPLVSTQETNGTTSSGSVSGPQLPHGLILRAPLGTSQAK